MTGTLAQHAAALRTRRQIPGGIEEVVAMFDMRDEAQAMEQARLAQEAGYDIGLPRDTRR